MSSRLRTHSCDDPFTKEHKEQVFDFTEFKPMAQEMLGPVKESLQYDRQGFPLITVSIHVYFQQQMSFQSCTLFHNVLMVENKRIVLTDRYITRKSLVSSGKKTYLILISNIIVLFFSNVDLQKTWYRSLKRYCRLKGLLQKYRQQEPIFQDYYMIVKKKNRQMYCATVVNKKQPFLTSTFQTMLCLKHPNLLYVKGIYDDQKNYIVVHDYFEGEPLFNFLVDDIVLFELQLATLIFQVLSLIKYFQENNIYHGNINACSVLINRESKSLEIALTNMVYYGFKLTESIDEYLAFVHKKLISPRVLNREELPSTQNDLYQTGVFLYVITFFIKVPKDIRKSMDAHKIYTQFMKDLSVDISLIEDQEQRLMDLKPLDCKYRHIYSSSQLDLLKKLLTGCTLADALNHKWFVSVRQKSKIRKQRVGLPSLKTIIEIKESSDREINGRIQHKRVSYLQGSISFIDQEDDDDIDENPILDSIIQQLPQRSSFPAKSHHAKTILE